MSREELAYGITIQAFSAGVSLITAVPGPSLNAGVLGRDILFYSGGTLLITGVTGGLGSPINITGLPYYLQGPAPFFISAAGATVTAHILTRLSQGFQTGTSLSP